MSIRHVVKLIVTYLSQVLLKIVTLRQIRGNLIDKSIKRDRETSVRKIHTGYVCFAENTSLRASVANKKKRTFIHLLAQCFKTI